jgi:hypothetical protein
MTDDASIYLLVDGERIDPIERSDKRHVFRLAGKPRGVRLCSRAAVPQELGVARDARSLGVAVQRILLVQPRRQRVMEADDARLTEGFHRFEHEHRIRWTNGDAVVPSELFSGMSGPCLLIVQLNGAMRYPDDGDVRQVA